MNTFEYLDALWDVFTNDATLCDALHLDTSDESNYMQKYRQQDMQADEFKKDDMPMVVFYFADAMDTFNDFVNNGFLRIDIYAMNMYDVAPIRKRIVQLMFNTFNECVRAEGQYQSGIRDVYKYRLEYTPLVITKG